MFETNFQPRALYNDGAASSIYRLSLVINQGHFNWALPIQDLRKLW